MDTRYFLFLKNLKLLRWFRLTLRDIFYTYYTEINLAINPSYIRIRTFMK